VSTDSATDGVPTYMGGGDPAGRFSDYYPAWLDHLADDVTIEGDGVAKLDGDFQSRDSREVDPNPRVTLDDLRERVAALWAAENDAGATVDMNGPNRPGHTTVATGPNRGCHLDGEHLLQEARDRIPIKHQLVHLSVRWVRSVRS
jgi:hypothetical protein